MSSKAKEAFFPNIVKDFDVSDNFDCSDDDDDGENVYQVKYAISSDRNIEIQTSPSAKNESKSDHLEWSMLLPWRNELDFCDIFTKSCQRGRSKEHYEQFIWNTLSTYFASETRAFFCAKL